MDNKKEKQIKNKKLNLNNADLFFHANLNSRGDRSVCCKITIRDWGKFLVHLASRQFRWRRNEILSEKRFAINSSESSDPLIRMRTEPNS